MFGVAVPAAFANSIRPFLPSADASVAEERHARAIRNECLPSANEMLPSQIIALWAPLSLSIRLAIKNAWRQGTGRVRLCLLIDLSLSGAGRE